VVTNAVARAHATAVNRTRTEKRDMVDREMYHTGRVFPA